MKIAFSHEDIQNLTQVSSLEAAVPNLNVKTNFFSPNFFVLF